MDLKPILMSLFVLTKAKQIYEQGILISRPSNRKSVFVTCFKTSPQKSTWTDSYHRRKEMWDLHTAQ